MSKVANALSSVAQDPVAAPVGHTVATASIAGSLTHWFNMFDGYYTPVISGIALTLSAIWYGITLYESVTIQRMIKEWRDVRAARRAYRQGWEAYERKDKLNSAIPSSAPFLTPTIEDAYKLGYEARAKIGQQ